jgi:peptide chain release factor 2
LGGYFDTDKLESDIKELTAKVSKSDLWDNPDEANKITQSLAHKTKELKEYKDLLDEIDTLDELSKDLDETEFDKLKTELEKKVSALQINTYLSGEYDNLNAYLEIHPGAGGTESCDWADMLYRMYTRFTELAGWSYEVISMNKGDEAGIKSVLLKIKGEFAYGYLKGESGVHRLIRISPFDSNKRRHTSFASVIVTPEFNTDINIEIKEEDLKIDVYHSSGAGGQSVNTSNSAVRITHLPTKIVVTCQNERSQLKNKDQAMNILKARLYKMELDKQDALLKGIKGDDTSINFGSQIRSYFLEPYKLIKDHRTNYESSDPIKVLDGDLSELLEYNLQHLKE